MLKSSQLLLLFYFAVLPVSTMAAQQTPGPPTPEDLNAAMADTVHGWFSYRSNGQPASDSARRMAALAMWDWEGGDRDRGLRLLYGASRLGVADSLFYYHGAFALTTFRRDSQALAFAEAGIRHWPRFWLLWSAKGDALRDLGHDPEARAAKAIADSLRALYDASGAH